MGIKKLGILLVILGLIFLVVMVVSQVTNLAGFRESADVLSIFLILSGLIFISLGILCIYFNTSSEKLKKVIVIITMFCALLLSMAIYSKRNRLGGASIEFVLSLLVFSFSALPLIIKFRYNKRKHLFSKGQILLSFSDLFSIALIILSVLFKLMHWPGSTVMLTIGSIGFIVTMIIWNRSFSKQVMLRYEAEQNLKRTFSQLEEKNKEILDSINYAKRLQEAILPPKRLIEKHLPQSFVLYEPKDIVAGDFYWTETIENGNEQMMFIAAADCTGHGVPGALVSVVCSNALNRAVNEFRITNTGKILDKVRELVLETFQKSESEVKDGMDISLASIKSLDKGYALINWSGANNPLWYISRGVFNEIAADKQSVGKTEKPQPFKQYTFIVEPGDILYFFTDGYADQFGGPKGKKFKYKQLEDILKEIKSLPTNEQKEILTHKFETWKGDLEQVDDVCIIGVKI